MSYILRVVQLLYSVKRTYWLDRNVTAFGRVGSSNSVNNAHQMQVTVYEQFKLYISSFHLATLSDCFTQRSHTLPMHCCETVIIMTDSLNPLYLLHR